MNTSFDLPDPFEKFDRALGRLGGGQAAVPEYRKPFSPDDYKPFQQKMLDYGGTGLRGVFSGLSFLGDHARGALTGDITQRQSGRQVLDHYRLTDPNDKGWGAWGAGLATDIATDPLTYIPFGPTTGAMSKMGRALSRAGELEGWGRKAAMEGFDATTSGLRAAGHSADEIAHLTRGGLGGINGPNPWRVATPEQESIAQNVLGRDIKPHEPMGGWAGIGLPYGPKAVATFGAPGKWLAGKADQLGDKLSFGNPLGRLGGYLFDSKRFNTLDEASQRGYATRGAAAFQKAAREGRGMSHDAVLGLEPILRNPAMKGRELDVLNMARDIGETSPLQLQDPALRKAVEATGVPGGLTAGYQGMRKNMREAGLPSQAWTDPYHSSYLPRESVWGEMERPAENSMFPTRDMHDMHRELLFNQAGVTGRLQDWSLKYSGLKGSTFPAEKQVFKDLVRDHIDKQAMLGVRTPVTRDTLRAFKDQSEAIVKQFQGFSAKHVTDQVPLYSQDEIGNVGKYAYGYGKKMASADAAVGALTHLADSPQSFIDKGRQYITVREAARRMGFKSYNPDAALGITEQHGIGPELLKALAPKGAPMAEPLTRQVGMGGVNKALDQFAIDAERLPELMKSQAKQQAAEGLKQPLGWWDSMNNAFKALAYPIWPASHTKNASTAAINNLRTDTPLGVIRSVIEQAKLMRNPSITDPVVNAERKAQFQNAGIFGGIDSSAEIAGMTSPTGVAAATKRLTMPLPGADRIGPTGHLMSDIGNMVIGREGLLGTLGNTGKAAWQAAKNPLSSENWSKAIGENLGIKGVFGQTADTLPAVNAGRIASMNIEDLFRGGQYKGMIRQGYSPEQAGRIVNQTHFDYSALTDFEKKTMRRIAPFYCVPPSHEILTRSGFKRYDRLYPNEEVLDYNHETGALSWQPLKGVAEFDYDGDLWTIERSVTKHNYQFTPNHRWPVITTRSFVKGKQYGGYRKIKESHQLNSGDTIPLTGEFSGDESILSPRHAAILGWVITDGYHRWRGNGTEMLVYQSPKTKKYLEEIVTLLGNKPRKPYPETGVQAVPVSNEDAKVITEVWGADHETPELVGRLSREAAEAMWDAMFKAEGWTVPGTGQQGFAQDPDKNPAILEAFQMLCLLTGRTANLNGRGCYIGKRKAIDAKEGFGRLRYKGKVWCPLTVSGCWVMRNDGAVILTGNTFMRKNIPMQASTIASRPGIALGQLYPAMQTRHQNEYVPDYMAGNVSVPIGETSPGHSRFISTFGLPIEEAFAKFDMKNGLPDTRKTAMGFLAQTNPLIKGPAEALFDTQFFSGRKLSDLQSPSSARGLGRLFGEENPQMLAQIMANSPFTRFFTSFDRSADQRKPLWAKALNLATGVRVQDVDVNKQKAIEMREAIADMLGQHKDHVSSYTNFYVKADQEKNMSPQEIEEMRSLATLHRDAHAYVEKRKREQSTGVTQ